MFCNKSAFKIGQVEAAGQFCRRKALTNAVLYNAHFNIKFLSGIGLIVKVTPLYHYDYTIFQLS